MIRYKIIGGFFSGVPLVFIGGFLSRVPLVLIGVFVQKNTTNTVNPGDMIAVCELVYKPEARVE